MQKGACRRQSAFFPFSDMQNLNACLVNAFLIANFFEWYCSFKFSLNDAHTRKILLQLLRSLPAEKHLEVLQMEILSTTR